MLASSLIMVSYVWFRYKKHTHSDSYIQYTENDNFAEENHYAEKSLAA